MCRFTAYHGPPISLDEMLYRPDHSIINQSVHAKERKEPLNGDGWGVGWYEPDREDIPALYRTVRPAWSDDNMRHVSPLVRTPVHFAHVRAASPGLAVQRLNCHPFTGGGHGHEEPADLDPVERGRRRLLFMHNGALGAYRGVIRRLRRELSDEVYFGIRGSTDSEHAFAVVQDRLGDRAADPSADDLAEATVEALAYLEGLKDEEGGADQVTHANLCLTDGRSLVATRYATPTDEDADGADGEDGQEAATEPPAHHPSIPGDGQPLSLYVGRAEGFVCEEGTVRAVGPDEEGAVVVSSERLFEDDRVWERVPANHLVLVRPDGAVEIEPIDAT